MSLSKSLLRVALATALLLLIPLVAMQFDTGVQWTLFDFLVAGVLLFGAGSAFVLLVRVGNSASYRLAVAVAVLSGLLLVWGNLAVGFIGSEDNPANLLYGAVLAMAFIGSLAARFRPLGMANTMFAAALVQFLVPFVAMAIWRPELNLGVLWVVVLNTLFAGLWVAAGWLFRRAGMAGSYAN